VSRAARLARIAAIAALLVTCGCSAPEPKAQPGQGTQERAQQLIDAGNDAFRSGNYGLAARRYAAAAVVKKDDPAAYYGMGMALSKLGRDEEARKAYAKARELAQGAAPASGGSAASTPQSGTH
jgi:Tfp pilus assembly protein PilF